MANNEVFANGLEVACKAADGMSAASFPDLCFTPGYPVPFANTAYAKDTRNGSRTVFITGKQVMLKDHSYFKTSTGNELARGKKGFFTTVKKGKAYFRSWSMNVKIEGYNVCRHTDSMTHNHGSFPGNTGYWKYWDKAWGTDPCTKEQARVEKACGGMRKKKYKNWLGKTKTDWVDNTKYKTGDWKKKNCNGLLRKPLSLDKMTNVDDFLDELNNELKRLNGVEKVIESAKQEVYDKVTEMTAIFAGKQVAKKVPYVGWTWQLLTLKSDAERIVYMNNLYDAATEEAERMSKQVINIRKELNDLKKSILKRDYRRASGKIADWQRTAGTLNKCTRARKCMLVPMEDTKDQSGGMKPGEITDKGCCPGQTGHHLIPGSFFKKSRGASGCNKYNYNKAAVVCAEGANDVHGSHGAAHKAMSVESRKVMDKTTEKLSYEDARDAAVKSHVEAFPLSMCDPDCIASQLDKYHIKDAKCDDDDMLKFKQLGPKDEDNIEKG